MNKETIADRLKELQNNICNALEAADGTGRFREDAWERPGGGGGRSRILENGSIIEKGGVNFSAVHGATPEKIREALNLEESDFFATGVSIVLHPLNPLVPIIHMNVRYFEMSNGTHWFGGGIDLTPHYVDREEAAWFHKQLKHTCDRFDSSYYPRFKKWADDYFYIRHRQETRGVGGIFFDRLSATTPEEKQQLFDFIVAVGETFAPTYAAIMKNKANRAYGAREKQWQLLRRGRYVEFNLVLDKGTKFGLETEGRIESILMSMPPFAQWVYAHAPEQGSREEETLHLLKKDINWLEKANV